MYLADMVLNNKDSVIIARKRNEKFYVYIHTFMRTYACTHAHAHTHARTHTHYTHTHINTHIDIRYLAG